MRTKINTQHMRGLSKTSALVAIAVMATACSNDASRLDELITQSISATENQNSIIKKSSGLKQPYPGDVAVSKTTDSGIRVAKRAVAVEKTIPQAVAPTVSRSALPIVTPVKTSLDQFKKSAVEVKNTVVRKVAAVPKEPSYKAPNGSFVMPQRQKPQNPLRMTGVDAMATGSVLHTPKAEPVLKTARSYKAVPTQTAKKPVGWENTKGARVTVKEGETLYNLSRRYGVPVSAIMAVNKIPNANSVRVGQRILIPTYNYSNAVPVSAPDSDPVTKASRASRGFQGQARNVVTIPTARVERQMALNANEPVASHPRITGLSAEYVVQSGDTLNRIAYKHGTSVAALKVANSLTGNSLKIGQKLQIPTVAAPVVAADSNVIDPIKTGSVPDKESAQKGVNPVYTKPAPTVSTEVQSTKKVATVATSGAGNFRWPARGRVISGFGDRTPTGINDGIDISVPVGTPIKASDSGTVIYSGSELEDFGKLILVSHDGGWVSAYAHASAALVRRGDKVQRGQVIAKSGRTGNAVAPKLHFELRKNSTPVNPLGKLSK